MVKRAIFFRITGMQSVDHEMREGHHGHFLVQDDQEGEIALLGRGCVIRKRYLAMIKNN